MGGDSINIYNLDCLVGMKDLGDESVDLITTDPPYGISFMGKDWDKFNEIVEPQGAYTKKKGFKKLPRQNTASMAEFFVPIWTECLRVLKAGAFAFVMCSPRADVMAKQINALQDAGFQVNFTPIYWAYASGFPKAQNIGKAVDKRSGRIDTPIEIIKDKLAELYRLSGKPLSQIDRECGFRASGYLRKTHRNDDGWGEAVPTLEKWEVISRIIGCEDVLSKRLAEFFKEAEREIIGKGRAGFLERNEVFELNNEGYGDYNITKPAIAQAKALDGSYGGFQPKPAVEVILVAMKPLFEKTFVDQALKNRKGITWLDDGRIPIERGDEPHGGYGDEVIGFGPFDNKGGVEWKESPTADKGRFPANLLVSDDALNDGKVIKGTGHFNSSVRMKGHTLYEGGFGNFEQEDRKLTDTGSFSRYFDLDKWWTEVVKELPESAQKVFPFLIVPKASKSEKNRGLEAIEGHQHNTGSRTYDDICANCGKKLVGDIPFRCQCENKVTQKRITKGNYHPTVKPIKLFSYLVTLGSRAGDVVLDPFGGTMTTAVACAMLGRGFIGYEIDAGSYDISQGRVKAGWQIKLEALGGKG